MNKEELQNQYDQNIKDFYSGDLSYEEFHYVQGQIIKQLKKFNN